MSDRTCEVPDDNTGEPCGKKPACRIGYCDKHYARFKRHGDPTICKHLAQPASLLTRMVPQHNGCIYIVGVFISDENYGCLTWDGKRDRAHRASYMHFVGPIPEGWTVDHVCHNLDPSCPGGPICMHRRCVNPEHLEAKPRDENSRLGKTTRGYCIHGHAFTPENTYITPTGTRRCRKCRAWGMRRAKALRAS